MNPKRQVNQNNRRGLFFFFFKNIDDNESDDVQVSRDCLVNSESGEKKDTRKSAKKGLTFNSNKTWTQRTKTDKTQNYYLFGEKWWEEPGKENSEKDDMTFDLLLRFFSILRARFAIRRARSSFSCSSRQRWKFSTTTPTNMLSTKKPTNSRNEMK